MTDNELPYGEAWLLETAIEHFVPLRWLLGSHESVSMTFNQPSHVMDRQELTATLIRMFERGELILDAPDVDADVAYASTDIVTELQSRALAEEARPSQRPRLDYGLSPLGASRWEHWAQPDWRRFYLGMYFDPNVDFDPETDRGSSYFLAVDDGRIDELLSHACELWDYDVIDSVQRELLEPFEATYWKTLPRGYRVHVHWQQVADSNRNSTPETRQANNQLLSWHRSVMD